MELLLLCAAEIIAQNVSIFYLHTWRNYRKCSVRFVIFVNESEFIQAEKR